MATCRECRFWDNEWRGRGEKDDDGIGVCRRYAPRAMSPENGDPEGVFELWPMWPKTLDDEWCGEWVQR